MAKYYGDPAKYAVAFQAFVGLSVALRNSNAARSSTAGLVMTERSLESGKKCFIPLQEKFGIIDRAQRLVLEELLNFLGTVSREPDLVIYLRCQPEESMSRLRKRDRQEEVGVGIDYLKELHLCHEAWLLPLATSETLKPKVVVFDNEAATEEDYSELLTAIKSGQI